MTRIIWLSASLLFIPQSASAHLVSTRFGELYSGMLHPITSLQHLIPWIALGLLGGLQKPVIARWAILFFPAGILLGLTLANPLPGLTLVQYINVASMVIVGLLVTGNFPLGKLFYIFLVLFFGVSHGYANSSQDIHGFEWVLYILGVILSAYILITLASAGSSAISSYRSWGAIAIRSVGSWIAAAGTMYSGFLLLVN